MATVSVTFRIDGIDEEKGYELPCPMCGRSILDAMGPEQVPCTACDGYGGPAELPRPRFELNVHNGNAAALLRLLQLGSEPAGSVDPRDLLVKLSLVGDVREHKQHFAALSRIATQAVRYERLVVWS